MFEIILDPALLFENGGVFTVGANPLTAAAFTPFATGGSGGYWRVGTGARWKFTTSARSMEVDSFVSAGATNGNSRMGVRVTVGGVLHDLFFSYPEDSGKVSTSKIWLPRGVNKTVELFVTAQHADSAGAAPWGVYPIRARFDRPAATIAPTTPGNRLVIYSDSIGAGGVAICPSLMGFAGLLKRGSAFGGYNGSVTLCAYGYRRLIDDVNSTGMATTFAAALLALNPTKLVLFIGSNDQAVFGLSAANFEIRYGDLLDALHAASPSLPILCVSPLIRGSESANAFGETLAQYRAAISNAVSTRTGFATYLDGLAALTLPDMGPDQTHPSTAGNIVLRDYLLPHL